MTIDEARKLIRAVRSDAQNQLDRNTTPTIRTRAKVRRDLCTELLDAMNKEPVYIAICVGYWGRADTPKEAVARMLKESGRRWNEVRYQVYKVHPETWVDQMGNWVWPGDVTFRPEMVEEYEPGKKRKKART